MESTVGFSNLPPLSRLRLVVVAGRSRTHRRCEPLAQVEFAAVAEPRDRAVDPKPSGASSDTCAATKRSAPAAVVDRSGAVTYSPRPSEKDSPPAETPPGVQIVCESSKSPGPAAPGPKPPSLPA